MAFSVRGKTAIVTGAGSGINLCFANLLLSRGCNVLFADLALRPEAEEVVKKHTSPKDRNLGRASFQRTDVSKWNQLERMFLIAEDEFGGTGADIVVPGAGIYEPSWSNFWHPPGTAKSRDAMDGNGYKLLDINLTHPIRTTQLAISHFLEKKKPGNILHVSSIAGQIANPVTPLYIASKYGVSGFVRCLRPLESRFGIRVTAVAPGVIKTPLWTEAPEKLKNVDTEGGDEWATPEEVAVAMLDLVEKNECAAGKIEGGSILEVGKNQVRLVSERNDPGPSGPGNTVSGNARAAEEIFENLREEGWRKSKL